MNVLVFILVPIRLMEAGMKVWGLTGDKQETAINIAYACQLMDNDMDQFIFNLDLYPTMESLVSRLTECCSEIDTEPGNNTKLVTSKQHSIF